MDSYRPRAAALFLNLIVTKCDSVLFEVNGHLFLHVDN